MRCCPQEGRERVQAVLPTAVAAVMAALRVIPGVAAPARFSFSGTDIQVLHSFWNNSPSTLC